MLPFIDLRGVRAARYQDENTAVIETELRYNVTPRWGAIGFIGAGRAWGRRSDFGDASTIVGKGVGVRYLSARHLGLWMGLDYAVGPEGGTGYIQVGSAWR
jgi:outer membrane translocation and assembly module TamA